MSENCQFAGSDAATIRGKIMKHRVIENRNIVVVTRLIGSGLMKHMPKTASAHKRKYVEYALRCSN